MNRVRVLVEGQTEQAFIREILIPYFAPRQIYLHAVMLRRQGGITRYAKAKDVIVRSLKEDAALICTTMVDFYGMPADWPGRDQANRCQSYAEKADIIEGSILKDIAGHLGNSFNPNRLMPYVQMHDQFLLSWQYGMNFQIPKRLMIVMTNALRGGLKECFKVLKKQ
jgi:hypothetical protein